jgi:tetratricopeptide (TPR) repeat protein
MVQIRQLLAWSGIVLCIGALLSCGSSTPSHPDLSNPAYASPAVKRLTAQLAEDTANASLYYQRGTLLLKEEKDLLALKDFLRAVALDSTRAEYHSAIGDLLFENKDVSGSVQWLKKAIELNPKDPRAHLKLAKMMLFAKEYKIAIDEVNTVLRQDVYNAEAYFLKGMVYKDAHDTDDAVSAFQTAVQVSPDFRDAYLQLGIMAAAKGDSSALRYWYNAYRLDTSDVFPLYARGKFFQDRNQFERAKEEYRAAIRSNRQYADAYFATGYILLQQDSIAEARRHFDLATKAEPQNPNAWYNRGLSAEMMNDIRSAEADYRRTLSLDPAYANAQAGLKRVGGK